MWIAILKNISNWSATHKNISTSIPRNYHFPFFFWLILSATTCQLIAFLNSQNIGALRFEELPTYKNSPFYIRITILSIHTSNTIQIHVINANWIQFLRDYFPIKCWWMSAGNKLSVTLLREIVSISITVKKIFNIENSKYTTWPSYEW